MKPTYFNVTVDLPGEPGQNLNVVATGPIAATTAVTRSLVDRHPAHVLKRARYTCRSGFWWGGRRVDPFTLAPAAA